MRLSTLGSIRAALTSQDLSFNTKKPLFKSRVTLPLRIINEMVRKSKNRVILILQEFLIILTRSNNSKFEKFVMI